MIQFDAIYVINRDSRKDRLEQFNEQVIKGWPFDQEPIRFPAVEGPLLNVPPWFRAGKPAWGCLMSHARIYEETVRKGHEHVLIFEDDAQFEPHFAERCERFLSCIPRDWDQIYLGGQHLKKVTPEQVNSEVMRGYNINRTHCYAIHSKAIPKVYAQFFNADEFGNNPQFHVDHMLGAIHESRMINVYCPVEWLVGQCAGYSDIACKDCGHMTWPFDASRLNAPDKITFDEPFVAVMGLHRSGSSMIAGILHHLGVHMGNKLQGYEGRHKGGFEASGLAQLMEDKCLFPSTERGVIKEELVNWIRERQKEAKARGTIAGGKYPHLCAYGDKLKQAVPHNLKVIVPDRDIHKSIASLKARSAQLKSWPKCSDEQAEAVQKWLYMEREKFLMDHEDVLRVPYEGVLDDPLVWTGRICQFLGLPVPTQQQALTIQEFVTPEYRTDGKVLREAV